MKFKTKTIWGPGFVSVADKYVQKAIGLCQALEVEYKGLIMTIPYEKLLDSTARIGSFQDKFGRKKEYKLYDFFWKGDDPNGKKVPSRT